MDWHAVRASGIGFAFRKATEGVGYVDPGFGTDWVAMQAASLRRGAYHFARPDLGNTPEAEADWFADNVALEDGDLVALDLEVGTGNLASWAGRFLTRLAARTGRQPWLYTYLAFVADHGLTAMPGVPLWLAAYQDAQPAPPAGFDRLTAWQFTSSARVPGVNGDVDQSYWWKE